MLEHVCEALIAARIERGDLVVALGGGVDRRPRRLRRRRRAARHRFVQVPTTLLAQVDSSVGGKTGINSPHGKNLIGAFHQPVLVLADTAVLDTLPPREFRAGYAEVVKYGLIGDAALLRLAGGELAATCSPAGRRASTPSRVSCRCQGRRSSARDERETGERALLNLGHTFGHALEAATGFSDRLLHGEAVAIGMVLRLRLLGPARPAAGRPRPSACARHLRGGRPADADRRQSPAACPTPTG